MKKTVDTSSPLAAGEAGRWMQSAPWMIAIVVLALDRITKMWVIENLQIGSFTPLLPGLALTHVHNRGIAFSLFAEGGPFSRVVLHAVILTAVVLIAWMLVRQPNQRRSAKLAFGMILGGALGNLTDRILYGWVVDFIHLWLRTGRGTWSWPDFNVADSAITTGAILLVLSELWPAKTAEGVIDAPNPD